MKCIVKSSFDFAFCLWLIFLMASCKSAPDPANESQTSATDSTSSINLPPSPESSYMKDSGGRQSQSIPPQRKGTDKRDASTKEGKPKPPVIKTPDSIDAEKIPAIAKGYAMVYCPAKMIIHVPSIIDAEITKEELSAAYTSFIAKVQGQNPDKNVQAIAKDVKGDSIDIYENMRVAIEFDSSNFEQISKNDDALQSFKNKQNLDWEWVVKPLQSTRKSIVIFKFYGKDPTSGEEASILEKTINIAVQVDVRSFFEKWSDFLLDDPKTTITAILIPVVSFLGGFISAKNKKTASA